MKGANLGSCCRSLVILAAFVLVLGFFCSLPFFSFLTWSNSRNVLHFASVISTAPSAVGCLFPSVCNIVLWLQLQPPPPTPPLLLTSLSTPYPHPLLPCSPLFHQIATAWANVHVTALPWDRRWLHCECEEKRKEGDCFQIAQAPKKRHFFHFLPGLREEKKKQKRKEMQDGGKVCWGWSGRGNCCWAQCKEVKLFLEGKSGGKTCLKGWAEAWKVSQRKAKTN